MTATDPAYLSTTKIETPEQQPGPYTGATDTDLYTGTGSTTTDAVRATAARAGKAGKAGKKRRAPEAAPVRKPTYAPPAAPKVPNVTSAIDRAQTAVKRAEHTASRAAATAAPLLTDVQHDLSTVKAAVRAHRAHAVAVGYGRWVHALTTWWNADAKAVKAQAHAGSVLLQQLQNVTAAQLAAQGTELSYAAYALAGQEGQTELEDSMRAAELERATCLRRHSRRARRESLHGSFHVEGKSLAVAQIYGHLVPLSASVQTAVRAGESVAGNGYTVLRRLKARTPGGRAAPTEARAQAAER